MITSMIILYIDDQPDGQDELEQRHQELLARQRQLQEQYQVYLSLTQKQYHVIFIKHKSLTRLSFFNTKAIPGYLSLTQKQYQVIFI